MNFTFFYLISCGFCDLCELPSYPRSKILAACFYLFRLISGDEAVVLLKPQFEWKNPPPRFDGVVRETADLKAIVKDFFAEAAAAELFIKALALSPVKGSKGNTEFLLLLHRTEGLADPYSAAELLIGAD